MVAVTDFGTEYGMDACTVAGLNKVPGIGGVVDVGNSEAGGAGIDAGGDEFLCGEGAVAVGEKCFTIQVHKSYFMVDSEGGNAVLR